MLRKPNRCDQCAKRGIGCSRDLPLCQSCEHLGIQCSYLRKLKSRRKLAPEVEQFVGRFKVEDTSNFIVLDNKYKLSFESSSRRSKEKKTKSTSSPESIPMEPNYRDNWINEYLRIVNSFPRKRIVNNFLALFEFPNFRRRANNDVIFLNVLKSFNIKANPYNKIPIAIASPFFDVTEAKFICDLCVDAFFKYVNPFIPLFTRRSFYSRSRSMFTLFAVWLCGIGHLPYSTTNESFKLFLEYKVHQLFKQNYLCKSFDTLQVFLIIALGLQKYSWVRSSLWYLHTVAVDIAYLLGIHRGSPTQFDSHMILERKLAYASIIHLGYILNWACDVPCLVPLNGYKPFKTKKARKVLSFYLKKVNSGPDYLSISDYCCLITAETTCQQGEFFNLINLCRVKAIKDEVIMNQLYSKVKGMMDELKSNSVYFSNKLLVLKSTVPSDYHHLLEKHAHFIKFRALYGVFWAYSLALYFKPSRDENMIKAQEEYINLALEQATEVLTYDILIGTDTQYLMRLGLVSRCLLFLIRHAPKYPNPARLAQTIVLGIKHFISLKNSTWIGGQALFSLALFYLVCKNYYQNLQSQKKEKSETLQKCYLDFTTILENDAQVINCFTRLESDIRFDFFH